ncbi:MAG: hypothetical protein P4L93_01380 [Coriobacteriia bacterium]|nr:hypothetical protein [Coriobacteriia bacterium]
MDDICSWFEVIRSLLPQRYEMRIVWERDAILVADPDRDSMIWLSTAALANRTPTQVVESIRETLRVYPRHGARVA